MDERTKKQLVELTARFMQMRNESTEKLAECTRHFLEHGRYPEDMGVTFRALAERASEIQMKIYNIRMRLEAELKGLPPFHGVTVPDTLPEEL